MNSVRGLRLASVALVLSAACHNMRSLPENRLNAADLPQRIWVTRADHSTIKLDAPHLTGDTLSGFVDGQYREMRLGETTAIRARERAPARTAVVVTATSVALLSAFMYLEARRDVGTAAVCLNSLDQRPQPYTPCCPAQDTVPC